MDEWGATSVGYIKITVGEVGEVTVSDIINNCNISEVYDDYIEWIRLIELTELTHNISTNQLLSHGLIVDRYCKDSIYIANEYDLLLYR